VAKNVTSDHRNNGGIAINVNHAPLQPYEPGNGSEDLKNNKNVWKRNQNGLKSKRGFLIEPKCIDATEFKSQQIFSYSTLKQPIKLYRFNLGLELVHSVTNTLKCNPISENTIAFKS
jgi:hypothetical protein